ncbi:THAP domain-containing protein 10-like [Ostrea edulis]|uniref:THAP domain-containing protein 10-like n=1 Tax=Ostrea edulis TaxID=37623 RepID=UPI0024AF0160|nr:THAP domain-containing protein 10-like [Ostrea edulis]
MASKNKGRMCVVAGCSKRQADGVSVHIFPKDQRQRAAWVRFVKLTRADWPGPSQYTVICSEHFNEDCYEARFSLMKDFGIPANKCLRKGSVPSIYPKRKRDELNDAFLQSPQLTTPPPERRAYAKRAKNMSSTDDEEEDERQSPTHKKSHCSDMQSSQQSCGSGMQYSQQQSSMQQDQQQQQYKGPPQQHYVPQPQQSQPLHSQPQQSQSRPSSSNKEPDSSNIVTRALVASGINMDSSQVNENSLIDSVNMTFASATERSRSSSK